jgi:hypothetical protein
VRGPAPAGADESPQRTKLHDEVTKDTKDTKMIDSRGDAEEDFEPQMNADVLSLVAKSDISRSADHAGLIE